LWANPSGLQMTHEAATLLYAAAPPRNQAGTLEPAVEHSCEERVLCRQTALAIAHAHTETGLVIGTFTFSWLEKHSRPRPIQPINQWLHIVGKKEGGLTACSTS
jgi:hypothetical protein